MFVIKEADLEYIILDGDKHPQHKFKTKDQTKTFDQVKDFDNYAVIVPDGYCVIDVDTTDDANILKSIVDGEDIKTRIYQTTRGFHFWFKASEPIKNFIKQRLGVSIYADCKSGNNGGKRAYVILKKNGKVRELLEDTPLDDVAELPKWLRVVSAPDQFHFKDLGEGSRNQSMFNYIVYLQEHGYYKADVQELLPIINQYVLAEPLGDYELSQVMREDAFKPDEQVVDKTKPVKGFNHAEFGDELIKQYHIVTINDQLYIYDHGYYKQDDRVVERKMIDMFPTIKQAQRNEVLAYIRIETHVSPEDLKLNPYIINLENTRLDVRTGAKLPFNPDAIEFDRIPVEFNPKAKSADVDKMLGKVFCGDDELMRLFKQMVGYTLIKHTRYRAGFMLVGKGRNGKSTVLEMIQKFLGRRNYSTIGLDKLTDRFATAELEHKLANIGDDINNVPIRETGTIKKLFTGNPIMVERKGEHPFELESYAKMIFSANEIPRSYDKTEGFYSRMVFIPFDAHFSAEDDDYDPNIEDKITEPEALSYLLNMALEGAQDLIASGEFCKPKRVEAVMRDYKTDNSTVLSWVADEEIDIDHILELPGADLYNEFQVWARNSGVKSVNVTGKKLFNKELIENFGLEPKQRQHGDKKRYFEISLD